MTKAESERDRARERELCGSTRACLCCVRGIIQQNKQQPRYDGMAIRYGECLHWYNNIRQSRSACGIADAIIKAGSAAAVGHSGTPAPDSWATHTRGGEARMKSNYEIGTFWNANASHKCLWCIDLCVCMCVLLLLYFGQHKNNARERIFAICGNADSLI